jgi:hypothetical protein
MEIDEPQAGGLIDTGYIFKITLLTLIIAATIVYFREILLFIMNIPLPIIIAVVTISVMAFFIYQTIRCD